MYKLKKVTKVARISENRCDGNGYINL